MTRGIQVTEELRLQCIKCSTAVLNRWLEKSIDANINYKTVTVSAKIDNKAQALPKIKRKQCIKGSIQHEDTLSINVYEIIKEPQV